MHMTEPAQLKGRLFSQIYVPETLLRRLGWTTTGYFLSQLIRFATNLVLTRILAPDLFGVMILLISLRVGLELFTDIGIAQNVVASRNAGDPRFYQTAWTLQLLRGLLLALISAALVPLISNMYGQDGLQEVLPFISLFFILTGFLSIGLPLAVKGRDTKRTALFDVSASVLGAAVMIAAALVAPNIWGLLAGNLLATLASTITSYLVTPGVKHRLTLNRTYVIEIVGFGKWIFISSIIYFLAANFDRLVLAKYVSLATLGLYGLARSLGDVFSQFSGRLGYTIIFPSVASSAVRGDALHAKLAHRRRQFLGAALVAIACFIALSEPLIRVLYDPRYAPAAQVLPMIGLAVWVGIICTLNENVLLGLGKPVYGAVGNAGKLLVLVVLLPLGVVHYGILGAAAASVAAEVARYGCLTVGLTRERVLFTWQDVCATVLMLGVALAIGMLASRLGLAGPSSGLFAITSAL
jgi:O-antigen/teichoic acid export membrane protein